jgi:hypothetical protein
MDFKLPMASVDRDIHGRFVDNDGYPPDDILA